MIVSRYLIRGFFSLLLASLATLPAGVFAQVAPRIVISEIHPSGSGNGTYAADWFEVTNSGTTAVDLSGWKVDDSSNAIASAVTLRGVTILQPGKSAVFLEGVADGSTDAALIASFSTAWFGTPTPPAGVLIGAYGGSGIGLSATTDQVNLFDADENHVTGVRFDAAPAGSPLPTFDNTAGLGSATTPLPSVTAASAVGVNGAFLSADNAEIGSPGRRVNAAPLTGIDLSTYVRIGRFDLPEPTRTTPPAGSKLAQEASAVTYNWDTDTLFITGDGSSSIVQVTKTGELIDSMTLAAGGSPQGTEFYDTEGLTYVGNGQFVMTEERDRRAVLFTYVPDTTLGRADTKTVTLGTFVDNEGLEGISYDPQTAGFIAVKEINPQSIFQTGIDFVAGTATNGSAATVNSTDLFNPALAGLLDFADVFALSNLTSLTGPQSGHLLVLSQESGMVVNIDRAGQISSSLTIATDPGNPLSVADQGHEGLTMDGNGVLYIVNEQGGGDGNHPQLWAYAPSLVPNQAPTALALSNVVSNLPENTNTTARLRVANVNVTDDGLGTNQFSLSGVDASFFEVDSSGLYVKAGTVLDFETKNTYSVTVEVDDPSVGVTPDATTGYTLTITDVVDETPPPTPSIAVTEVAPWGSGDAPYAADWFEVTNTGATAVDITGWKMDDNSNAFASAVALSGITTIAPGESVIFMETGTLATTKAAFLTAWFGATPPVGLQVGSYSGSGAGLSTGGDTVNLFDAAGNRVTGVAFQSSTTGFSFDNAAATGSTTLPLPIVSTLSVVGTNGAFLAADGTETGSPGRIANPAPTAPTAPQGLAAVISGHRVTLSWSAPASGIPTSYTVMARTTGGQLLLSVPIGLQTSLTVDAPDGVFVISVLASNNIGSGPESNTVTLNVPGVPPVPGNPSNLVASLNGDTATLTWTAPAPFGVAEGYFLAAGTTQGFTTPLAVLPLPAAPNTTTIGNIPPGTYWLRLYAGNASGVSAPSNEVSISVPVPTAPGAPTLNPPTITDHTVGLSWTPGAGGTPTSYLMGAATTRGGAPAVILPLTGTSTSFANVPSGTYYLRMVAVNAVGMSQVSNEIEVIVP